MSVSVCCVLCAVSVSVYGETARERLRNSFFCVIWVGGGGGGGVGRRRREEKGEEVLVEEEALGRAT